MNLISYEGDSYVKLEVVYTIDNFGVDVRFNVNLLNSVSLIPEYGAWDAELCPEARREPQHETELLASILDQLLVDRYIDLERGLLESIGVYPTRIAISLNERRKNFVGKRAQTQVEIKKIIENAIAEFTALKV